MKKVKTEIIEIMKNYKSLLFIFLLLSLLNFTSCTDEIDELIPEDATAKFLGTWTCQETGDGMNSDLNVYTLNITRNPSNKAEVLISNFNQLQETAIALVVSNSIFIESQKILNGTITIEGEGVFSNGEILLNYSVDDGADLENFTARYYKPSARDELLKEDEQENTQQNLIL
ncbi:MAG: hypothetical protein ACOC4J_04855 [Bacteroidota bacterium]